MLKHATFHLACSSIKMQSKCMWLTRICMSSSCSINNRSGICMSSSCSINNRSETCLVVSCSFHGNFVLSISVGQGRPSLPCIISFVNPNSFICFRSCLFACFMVFFSREFGFCILNIPRVSHLQADLWRTYVFVYFVICEQVHLTLLPHLIQCSFFHIHPSCMVKNLFIRTGSTATNIN